MADVTPNIQPTLSKWKQYDNVVNYCTVA